MEKVDFDEFKIKVLKPYLDELKEYDAPYNCLKINLNYLDRIYWNYQKIRNIIKLNYMDKDSYALDRHKVGASFIYGILCSNVIHVKSENRNLPPHLLMANEYFAVNVAINIVEMYKRTTDEGCEEYNILIPRSYHEKGETNNQFLYELCLGLYEQNIKKCFNVFAYSTILFQMEEKTDYIRSSEKKQRCYAKLDELAAYKVNWNGNNAAPFSSELIDKCKNVINELQCQPEIYPTAINAIQFEYRKKDGSYLKFEIYLDKVNVFCIISEKKHITKTISLDDVKKEVDVFYESK